MSMLKSLFSMFWQLFRIPLGIVLAVVALFAVISALFYLYFYIFKGLRIKKGAHVRVKQSGFLKKIFFELPRRYVLDIFEREAD